MSPGLCQEFGFKLIREVDCKSCDMDRWAQPLAFQGMTCSRAVFARVLGQEADDKSTAVNLCLMVPSNRSHCCDNAATANGAAAAATTQCTRTSLKCWQGAFVEGLTEGE